MPTFTAFCDQGHELIKVMDALPDSHPKTCKHCGSNRVEFFNETELELNLGKIRINQTVICQNLATNHQFSEVVPVYDVEKLFYERDLARANAKIKVKSNKRR